MPATWLLVCTLTAGMQKLFHPKPSIGFLAHAQVFGDALAAGKVIAPAKNATEMARIVFNDYVDATLTFLFVAVVLAMLIAGVIAIRKALGNPKVSAVEVGLANDGTAAAHG